MFLDECVSTDDVLNYLNTQGHERWVRFGALNKLLMLAHLFATIAYDFQKDDWKYQDTENWCL